MRVGCGDGVGGEWDVVEGIRDLTALNGVTRFVLEVQDLYEAAILVHVVVNQDQCARVGARRRGLRVDFLYRGRFSASLDDSAMRVPNRSEVSGKFAQE